jgi:hypothetical protein
VLKLEAELLQQQQEERRDRQRQPAGDVGGEQNELPGDEVTEGDSASVDPPGEHRHAPSKQVVHHIERRLGLEVVGLAKRSHGVGGGVGVEQESANAKGCRELEGERVQRVERMRKCNCYTRGESLFKEDSPARAPRRRKKSRPARTKATQPLTRGPGPQVIQLVCGSPSAEKANRYMRSKPPPAVVRLFIPPPQETIAKSLTWGPGPMSHTPWASVPGCRKVEPPLASVLHLLEAAAENGEGEFLNQRNGIEAPRAWPGETIRHRGHGSVNHGTDVAVGVTEDGLAVITSASTRKRRAKSPIRLWPHLQARILP